MVDITQMKVTQIEYSFNIETKYVSEYIKFMNYAYKANENGIFKNHSDFTVIKNKPLNSSFYLKTNTDFRKRQKVNFCLNIYNKSDQLSNKVKKDMKNGGRTFINEDDIESSKNILRVECKAYHKHIANICKKYNLKNNLENLLSMEIAYYQVTKTIKRFFATGDFCSKSYILSAFKNDCYIIDLDTPLNELSASKAKIKKEYFEGLDIYPYFYIPPKWNINKLENPIKLIDKKINLIKEKNNMIQELEELEKLAIAPIEKWSKDDYSRFFYLLEHKEEYEKKEKKEKKKLECKKIIEECKNKIILTPKEVAAILNMGVNQVYGLFDSKGFPSTDLNGKKIIEKEAFFEWLHSQKGKRFNF